MALTKLQTRIIWAYANSDKDLADYLKERLDDCIRENPEVFRKKLSGKEFKMAIDIFYSGFHGTSWKLKITIKEKGGENYGEKIQSNFWNSGWKIGRWNKAKQTKYKDSPW